MNGSAKSAGGVSGAVITVAAPGGYVSADAAFVVSGPLPGRPGGRPDHPSGPGPRRTLERLENRSVDHAVAAGAAAAAGCRLGFWEWDSRAVEQGPRRGPHHGFAYHRDHGPSGGREKTFACYGLRQYWNHQALPVLERPGRRWICWRDCRAPDLYYPPAGEVLLIPLDEPLPRNATPGAWPPPALPLRVSSGVHRGSLLAPTTDRSSARSSRCCPGTAWSGSTGILFGGVPPFVQRRQ